MSPIQQMLLGVGAVATKTYVDDIFSTFVYAGNGSARSINNGIDLSGEGGLVWVKRRNQAESHIIVDTERGGANWIASNESDGSNSGAGITSFNSTGFSLDTFNHINGNGHTYASWSFRKAPGFFDVVTWTGDNNTNRAISHSLNSTPGMIIVKNTSNAFDWAVWHRSVWNTSTYKSLQLNKSGAQNGWNAFWGVSAPTSSNFYVRSNGANVSGQTYVAYVFAHDDQQFGAGGNEEIIKCGSYTGNASSDGPTIDLGWEPQWLMIKVIDDAEDWFIWDHMRGMVTGGNDPYLSPNKSTADGDSTAINVRSNGFQLANTNLFVNGNNKNYLYVAIRREDGYVGKPPELGTDVFAMDTGSGSSTIPNFDSGFPVDWAITRAPADTTNWETGGRLIQGKWLETNNTVAESPGSYFTFDSNTGWMSGATAYNSSYQAWMWKRHTGFDVLCYEGTGSDQALSHSLSKNVEMAWIKKRDTAGGAERWVVFHKDLGTLAGNSSYPHAWQHNLTLNETWVADIATSRFGAPTSTHFTVKTHETTNRDGSPYLMMLFASVSNISSVGSYSGSSSEKSVTTGFTPRFIIIRRTNSSGGNWIVLDSLRGLGSSGNDNFLFLESNSAQGVTSSNYINTTATGFVMPGNASSDINYASGEYVYYAHA